MKLNLSEDLFNNFDGIIEIEVPDVVADIPVEETDLCGPEPGEDTGIADIILSMISNKNQSISSYISFKANVGQHTDFIDIIDKIVADEMSHIGMLQAMLKKISPNAAVIEQGQLEAEQQLDESLLNESIDQPYFRAFITNLGKYNEGELDGEWVEFPIDQDDFQEVLNRIGIDDQYQEWFVTDYECNLNGFDWRDLGEYPGYDLLQECGKYLESVEDADELNAVMEASNCSIQEAIEKIDSGSVKFLPDVSDEEDLGYKYVVELYDDVENLPKELIEACFNYGMLGRDLSFDSYGENDEMSAGEYFCGDENATDEEIGEAFVEEEGFPGIDVTAYFDFEQLGIILTTQDDWTITTTGAVAVY